MTLEEHEHQGALLQELGWMPDDDEVPEWKDLNELLVSYYRWRSDSPEDQNPQGEIELAVRVLEDAYAKGLLEKYENKSVRDTPLRITDSGLRALPEWNVAALDGVDELDSTVTVDPADTVDSSAWTGSRLIYLDSSVVAQIRTTSRKLQLIAATVNYQSEEDRRDILGLVNALVALCEMAEPEISIIDKITSHPKFKMYAALIASLATIRGALGI